MPDGIALPGAPLPLSIAPQPRREDDPALAEARRAAEEFEAVFLAQMMAPMFEGLETDDLDEGGMGEEIFRPMLVERYAQALSQSGGIGLADSIVRELMRLQATAATPEAADGADR